MEITVLPPEVLDSESLENEPQQSKQETTNEEPSSVFGYEPTEFDRRMEALFY